MIQLFLDIHQLTHNYYRLSLLETKNENEVSGTVDDYTDYYGLYNYTVTG